MCVSEGGVTQLERKSLFYSNTHTHTHIPDTFRSFPGSSEKLSTEQRGIKWQEVHEGGEGGGASIGVGSIRDHLEVFPQGYQSKSIHL